MRRELLLTVASTLATIALFWRGIWRHHDMVTALNPIPSEPRCNVVRRRATNESAHIRLVFAFIAKDISAAESKGLRQNIDHAIESCNRARMMGVLVVLTDSSEDTLSRIDRWKATAPYPVVVRLQRNWLWVRWWQKLVRRWRWPQILAGERNRCLQQLRGGALPEFDYLVTVDSDVSRPWSGFEHVFETTGWAAVSAHGVWPYTRDEYGEKYADMWAFRAPGWTLWDEQECTRSGCFRMFWDRVAFQRPTGPRRQEDEQRVFLPNRCTAVPGFAERQHLVPVDSAFGGASVYHWDSVKGCQYVSPLGDCEHVAFHACVRAAHPDKDVVFVHTQWRVPWKVHDR